MAENTNRWIGTGNLTKDPEGRDYGSGDNAGRVVELRIACNRRPKRGGGDAGTDFITVKAFNGLGRICEEHLSKGRKVLVVGRLQIDQVPSRDDPSKSVYFTSVVADSVEFLDGPRSEDAEPVAAGAASAGASDLPF